MKEYKSNLETFLPQNSIAKILANKITRNSPDSAIPQNLPPAIVAGNGASYGNIDYSRLPFEFDVFRCGQFYFEDKYYLGKNIKAVSINPIPAFAQFYTMLKLMGNNEYKIDRIFMQDCPIFRCKEVDGKMDIERENIIQIIDLLSHFNGFVDRVYGGSFSNNIIEFLEWSKLASIYDLHHITTGLIMCGVAVAMGHKEIYIAGIDFYDNNMGAHYFTNMSRKNIRANAGLFDGIMDKYGTSYKGGMHWHKKVADIEGLYFLEKCYGVKFYSLCENSPINELIPLAPKTGNNFQPENKQADYINDICIPEDNSFYLARAIHRAQQQQQQQQYYLKSNFYFKIIYDLLCLPNHIKRYLKAKKAIKEKINV